MEMAKYDSTNKTSKISAWILYIVNIIIMVICVLLFSFGLWMITSPSTLASVIDGTGSATLKALLQDTLNLRVGIAVTAVATFLFFVCFMGFYGALTKSPFLLFMYAALVILLLLLECALLYYFSSNLLEKGLQDDGQWTHAMRLIFKCCEYNTSIPEETKPPWSCCGSETYPDNCTLPQIYKKNCQISFQTWLDRYQLPLYSSLAVLHVVLASLYHTTIVFCVSLAQLAIGASRSRRIPKITTNTTVTRYKTQPVHISDYACACRTYSRASG